MNNDNAGNTTNVVDVIDVTNVTNVTSVIDVTNVTDVPSSQVQTELIVTKDDQINELEKFKRECEDYIIKISADNNRLKKELEDLMAIMTKSGKEAQIKCKTCLQKYCKLHVQLHKQECKQDLKEESNRIKRKYKARDPSKTKRIKHTECKDSSDGDHEVYDLAVSYDDDSEEDDSDDEYDDDEDEDGDGDDDEIENDD